MKVLDATVNWMYGWGNMPRLFLLVDAIPSDDDLRYQVCPTDSCPPDRGLYFAELDGYVSFYCYDGSDEEYSGCKSHLVMEDGSERVLEELWSSRPGVMNRHFTHSINTIITDDSLVWERGYTFSHGNVTVELTREILAEFCPYAQLIPIAQSDGGFIYRIAPAHSDDYKSSLPPKDDPRWDSYGTWHVDIRGSEKFRLSNEENIA